MLTATATRTSEYLYLPFKVSRRMQRLDVRLMKEGTARVGAGMRLILLRYGQPVQTTPIASDEQIVTLQGLIGTGGYVRAELRGVPEAYPTNPTAGRLDMEALTNPIFLVAGYRPASNEPQTAPPPADQGGSA